MTNAILRVLILAAGWAVTVLGSGRVIGRYLERFQDELEAERGLEEAGRVIGIAERTLIYVFICAGSATAIGLLIAAKSILRFGDVTGEARKHAEYVIIGTLVSFALAVPLSYLFAWMAFDVIGGIWL